MAAGHCRDTKLPAECRPFRWWSRAGHLVKRAASAFEPGTNAVAGEFKELELNGSAGLPLNDDRA